MKRKLGDRAQRSLPQMELVASSAGREAHAEAARQLQELEEDEHRPQLRRRPDHRRLAALRRQLVLALLLRQLLLQGLQQRPQAQQARQAGVVLQALRLQVRLVREELAQLEEGQRRQPLENRRRPEQPRRAQVERVEEVARLDWQELHYTS